MREQNNAQKLKQELEKSRNVLNVEIMPGRKYVINKFQEIKKPKPL